MKVYVKPVGDYQKLRDVKIEQIVGLAKFKYDDTHEVLYDPEETKYNFTIVTTVAGEVKTEDKMSKTFYGECYIVGLNGDTEVDVAEDVPAFYSTLVLEGKQ
jgi:hypothetical protein